jgi:hypothetical protein
MAPTMHLATTVVGAGVGAVVGAATVGVAAAGAAGVAVAALGEGGAPVGVASPQPARISASSTGSPARKNRAGPGARAGGPGRPPGESKSRMRSPSDQPFKPVVATLCTI